MIDAMFNNLILRMTFALQLRISLQNADKKTTLYTIRSNPCKHIAMSEIAKKVFNASQQCVVEKVSLFNRIA